MENNSKKILGLCCVCKESKKIRDNCIMLKSEEECQKEIKVVIDCISDYKLNQLKKSK